MDIVKLLEYGQDTLPTMPEQFVPCQSFDWVTENGLKCGKWGGLLQVQKGMMKVLYKRSSYLIY